MTILQKKNQIERKERFWKVARKIVAVILILIYIVSILEAYKYYVVTVTMERLVMSFAICIIMANVLYYIWLIYDYFTQTRVIYNIQYEKYKISIAEKFELKTDEYVEIKKAYCKEKEVVKYYAKLLWKDKKMYIEICVRNPGNEMTVLTKTDNFENFNVYYVPKKL